MYNMICERWVNYLTMQGYKALGQAKSTEQVRRAAGLILRGTALSKKLNREKRWETGR